MTTIDYAPDGDTLRAFMQADDFVRCAIGPFGSGKSAACAVELFRRACQQKPDSAGVRKTRWAVIRSTYPQLRNTTIATWRQWFDDRFGQFRWSPTPQHNIVLPLADKTVLDMEVRFIALDGPSAEADLRGAELTGCWINECSEVPKNVMTFALGRVGRYPAMRDAGPTWSGVVMDSNAWDQDHWLHGLWAEPPKGWRFFRQPGAVMRVDQRWAPNPAAENLRHLPPEYYERLLAGQSDDWVRVFVANEFGFSIDGKVVYPEWSDGVHVAVQPLVPIAALPLHIGLDFGLTPAAIFGQRTARGRWLILDELIAEDMGLVRFSELLRGRLAERYAGFAVAAWGDPAGNARAQTDERSCLEVVREHAKIPCQPAPTNQFPIRREAVANSLNRLIDGQPGFVLSPTCKMLRKGFAGGYHFRRVKVSGDEKFHDAPDKNAFSHPHDALQYLMSGGGEAAGVVRGHGRDPMFMPDPRTGRLPPLRYHRIGIR
jgi:hypothetical protein